MSQLESINCRGLANGWHAQQLQQRSHDNGETMSVCYERSIKNSSACSVPAKAIKITNAFITYQFLDGSISNFENQNR